MKRACACGWGPSHGFTPTLNQRRALSRVDWGLPVRACDCAPGEWLALFHHKLVTVTTRRGKRVAALTDAGRDELRLGRSG